MMKKMDVRLEDEWARMTALSLEKERIKDYLLWHESANCLGFGHDQDNTPGARLTPVASA